MDFLVYSIFFSISLLSTFNIYNVDISLLISHRIEYILVKIELCIDSMLLSPTSKLRFTVFFLFYLQKSQFHSVL